MFAQLVNGFSNLLNPTIILLIVAGVLLGNMIGALPGLTPTMAMALALPITFTFDTISAVAFLVGIAKGGTAGCGLTAVSIGIPGIPAATCTVMDGYPMMQQGKGIKAMKTCIYSSVAGDTLSDIVMILVAAPLSAYAVKMGPPELTALFIFAMATVSTITSDQPIKGLIAIMLGSFLSTFGIDPISGASRFTFGSTDMMSGFSTIPVLIGLFAVPEVLKQIKSQTISGVKKFNIKHEKNKENDNLSKEDWKKISPVILMGTLIGTVIGAIPGVGSSAAAFITYSETKNTSKHPEEFGHGAIEGVAASEAGNSAVNGASLIPLLTLGIPGDTTSAVMLGAFILHGITPGPLMMSQHSGTVYTIFAAFLLANLVNLFIARYIMIPSVMYVLRVKTSILLPLIMVCCVVGAYATNNSYYDVKVMLLFGIIGWGMDKFNFPRTPLLIGLLLAPMLENNLRRSLIMATIPELLARPVVIVILLLTVLVLFIAFRRQAKKIGVAEEEVQED